MAHLFTRLDGGGWQAVPLNGSPVRVPGSDEVWLVPVADTDGGWVLVASPASPLRVNGFRPEAGLRVLRVLRDRDEIDTGARESFFFSTEGLARIEAAPNIDGSCVCPRCKQTIHVGSPAVQCPSCGVWYHQLDPLKCWTYDGRCALCDQSTDLDAGYRFTPEKL